MSDLTFNYFERPIPKLIFDWNYIASVICRDLIYPEYLQEKVIENDNLLCLIIASLGEDIMGVAIISTGSDSSQQAHAFIDLVCAKHQRVVPGVGSIMLTHAEEYIQEKGFTIVNLHALTEELAKGFYPRHGYKKCEVDEINCATNQAQDCHVSLRPLFKGEHEGYSMTKCLLPRPRKRRQAAVDAEQQMKRMRYLSSRLDHIEEYLKAKG
jgi:ribosomal protein S18 acetylase RimI-like enzyme